MTSGNRLRIVHIMRAPMGGVFRHVRDLALHHKALGHDVTIICDAPSTPGYNENGLADLVETAGINAHRIAMPRSVGLADIRAGRNVLKLLKKIGPDVIHGHGAKGGVYGRAVGKLASGGRNVVRAYSPHGGSLHFDPASRIGKLYFAAERMLERQTDALMFVAQYEQDTYREKIGEPTCPSHIIYNGLAAAEFEPVTTASDPYDFVFIGEIRELKGYDLVIEAARRLVDGGLTKVRVLMVGSGPEQADADRMIAENGLQDVIDRHGPMPARNALANARCVVMPSRAEAMPYIVLETLGAGMPIIASAVGGIPEIFSGTDSRLIRPEVDALENAMRGFLEDPAPWQASMPKIDTLKERFSVEVMGNAVMDVYQKALAS